MHMTTLCFRIFPRKNVATPHKTTYLERLAYIWSGERTGTSCKSPAALILTKIMFLLRFLGIIVKNARPVAHSLVQRNFRVPPGKPILRKSAKAIREIAFGNAGKTPIADSFAAPTDFIFVGARGIFLAGQKFQNIYFREIRGFCFRIFHRKNVPTPQKTSYLERSAHECSGEKKGTPGKSSAAPITNKIKF